MLISNTHVYDRMAGIFRGVLIFIIVVFDLAVTKIFHSQKLMTTNSRTCTSAALTKNILKDLF